MEVLRVTRLMGVLCSRSFNVILIIIESQENYKKVFASFCFKKHLINFYQIFNYTNLKKLRILFEHKILNLLRMLKVSI